MISSARNEFSKIGTAVAINTDAEALERTDADLRILLLDHGEKPFSIRNARAIAVAQRSATQSSLTNVDCVLLVAGLGGVCGTGIAPVIAEIAREIGIFCIAIPFMPAFFEALERTENAADGLEALQESADAVIPVYFDDLLAHIDENARIGSLFELGDAAVAHFCGSMLKAFDNTTRAQPDFFVEEDEENGK